MMTRVDDDGQTSPLGDSPADRSDAVGPYQLVEVLGEGGMGVVWLAEQREPVRRQVALKIIKLGMDTKEVVARFEAERQALALMEHAAIAKVFDAGATDSGRPYFVMELVQGQPITEFCDQRRYSVDQRVALFATVCRAVQHAHQKGIIHRDLKPSNILVGEEDGSPLPKIIDFGVARAIELPGDDGTRLTQVDQVVGTPAYVSPEQLGGGGLDIDTRTDVYSLGVVLYELLAGALPFAEGTYRSYGFLRNILELDPPTPSARVTSLDANNRVDVAANRAMDPEALRRALQGDLDWIVVRAIEKDRERRFETANGLAEDLERYLQHRPVSARPPTRAYLVGKFVRRHRAGVTFGSALAVLLVGFAVSMTVQAGRISRARSVAQARAQSAERLVDFMLGDMRERLGPIGRLDLLEPVADQALDYFRAVPEGELSDEELFSRSEALRQLGQVRLEMGTGVSGAAETFEESLLQAASLVARNPSDGEWQMGLGASHYWVGYVHYLQGELDQALEQFLPYLEISEELVAREPGNQTYISELGYAHSNIGSVRERQGNLDAAVESFRATLSITEELVRLNPGNAELELDFAHIWNSTAVLQRRMGDLNGATASHRQELDLKRALVDRDSTNRGWQRYLASGHAFMGDLLLARGKVDSAMVEIASARALNEMLVANDPSNAAWRRSLANVERLTGQVLVDRGRADDAIRWLESSHRSLRALVEATPDNQDVRWELARSEAALGVGLLRSGSGGRAVNMLRASALAMLPAREQHASDPRAQRVRAEMLLALASALSETGDAAAAAAAWERAHAAIGPVAAKTRDTDLLGLSATALMELGRLDEAGPLVEDLLERGYRRRSFLDVAREKGLVTER